jgi:hypothetical protein
MNGTATDLIGTVKSKIATTTATITELNAERSSLALFVARDDATAAARSAAIRAEVQRHQATIEDLKESLGPLAGFARLEQAAIDADADRQRRKRARLTAEANVKAAEAVDAAAAQLAVAMLCADRLTVASHECSAFFLGAEQHGRTQLAGDAVLGALVLLGALPPQFLPPVFVGELRYVRPLSETAKRHAAMVAKHVPADDLVEEVAA